MMMAATAAPAQHTERPKKSETQGMPPGVKLSAQHIGGDEKTGAIVAEGEVTIEAGFGRMQADKMTLREGRFIEAEGNVLLVWGNNRVSGTRMTYDMGVKDDPDPDKRLGRGVIENAVGQVDPEFFFSASEVDTIGDDHIVLHHATVTTCTQPVPYWSFKVSKAKIKVEGYAHMYNLRPTIRNVPFFYLPYLLWPVKRERAPGLLFPEFGTTSQRGSFMSLPVFFPLGASADLTVMPEYYTIGGWAAGVKLRLVPNRDGYAEAEAQYIDDQIEQRGRYRFVLKQTQNFLNGFRMVSDVDIVSDFNYYTDFVRNLTYASSPTILGRMAFTRNGAWTSILIQEQYRDQLFAPTLTDANPTLLQTTLPEIEWRGRSRRIGNTPLYFTFVSSMSSIRQDSTRLKAHYLRGDFFPTLSASFSPAPWIDITPTVTARSTYWSQQQLVDSTGLPIMNGDAVEVSDHGLWRNLLSAGIDFRGPKLVRIFETKPKVDKDGKVTTPSHKYKNTIEPDLNYTYQQAFDKAPSVIVYDEIDQFGANANGVTYGVSSRLIAQRPRAPEEKPGSTGEKILVPEGESGKLREAPSATPDIPEPALTPEDVEKQKNAPMEPIEIASVSIAQNYSFNSTFKQDLDGNPNTPMAETHLYPIALTGRYNPSRLLSFNLTGNYDTLFKKISDVSLSGNFHEKIAQGLFSLVYKNGLGYDRVCSPDDPDPINCPSQVFVYTPHRDETQVRFQGNFGPLLGRLRLGVDFTYNLTPAPPVGSTPGEKHLPYRRLRLEYYTQCCGFLTEYLVSKYSAFPRREFRFAVDLRGIGKLFDFNQANQ